MEGQDNETKKLKHSRRAPRAAMAARPRHLEGDDLTVPALWWVGLASPGAKQAVDSYLDSKGLDYCLELHHFMRECEVG